jgi:transposase
MENVRFVGLDVHADSIVIAVAEPGRGEPGQLATIGNDTGLLLKRLRRLGKVKCCYEAGPTGFGLQRALTAEGIDCVVVAPSLVPTRAGDRVKTDRRDAVRLARFLRSGDLTEVYVPDEATEAMRDLERARDDAKKSERVARHQLSKFLLRHGRRYGGKTSWTGKHFDWIRGQHLVSSPSATARPRPGGRRGQQIVGRLSSVEPVKPTAACPRRSLAASPPTRRDTFPVPWLKGRRAPA